MKKIAGVIASAALLAVSASAQSEGFNQSKFYAGGGVSVNLIEEPGMKSGQGTIS